MATTKRNHPQTEANEAPRAVTQLTLRRVTLTKEEARLVSEAISQAERTRNVMEDALVEFGRWVLLNVFDDNPGAALDEKRQNRVWSELLRRAGGPTLRLSRRLLHIAVEIAARDKRIQDDAWRLLEAGRKEILLPLGDETLLREAAQHVVSMKLTQRATRDYVRHLLEDRGRDRPRRITAPHVRKGIRGFLDRMADPTAQSRIRDSLRALPSDERRAARKDLLALRTWAERTLRHLGTS